LRPTGDLQLVARQKIPQAVPLFASRLPLSQPQSDSPSSFSTSTHFLPPTLLPTMPSLSYLLNQHHFCGLPQSESSVASTQSRSAEIPRLSEAARECDVAVCKTAGAEEVARLWQQRCAPAPLCRCSQFTSLHCSVRLCAEAQTYVNNTPFMLESEYISHRSEHNEKFPSGAAK
jgi:hypothetical protein